MFANQASVVERNRDRLVAAAAEVFMEAGYRASLDKIIARAGVVRQTLYNHFSCKDELFVEAIRRLSAAIVITLEGDPGDVRETLVSFGTMIRAMALSPQGIAMYRILIAEAPRFAKLARSAYAEGSGKGHKQLTAFLRKAMNGGLLRRDDPKLAASMLLGMLVSADRDRCLFGVQDIAKCEAAEVNRAIDCFLRAYAP